MSYRPRVADFESAFERSRVVRVGEAETFVGETGTGPDVVFLHGNPDTHVLWSELARRLAPEHHCLAPDLPGWGRSRPPRGYDCSLAQQAAWVKGVFDGLALPRAHLVVHDIGGSFGLAFAALHPERIQTLTIFNTSFFADFRWHTIGKAWRTPIVGELVMLLAPKKLFIRGFTGDSPAMPLAYAEHAYREFDRWPVKRMILRWYRAMTYARVMPGWTEAMLAATRAIPKQVIWGMTDGYVPAATADRFAAPVHRIEEHGHWSMMEAPDVAAPLVAALVKRGA
jgi:pimeloyl-ACP methyl ester carboxylesterase